MIQALTGRLFRGRQDYLIASSTATDDRGEYRLAGLYGGPFYVRAAGLRGGTRIVLGPTVPAAGSGDAFAPEYYPDLRERTGATLIPASQGQEAHADFRLTLTQAFRIRTIAGHVGNQAAEVQLLLGEEDYAAGRVVVNARTGQVEIHDVVPGSYVFQVTQGTGEAAMRAQTPVVVSSGDVTGVVARMERGVEVLARIEGGDPTAVGTELGGMLVRQGLPAAITLRPLGGSTGVARQLPARAGDDGLLHVNGVLAGRYALEIRPFSGYVGSVRTGANDLTQHPELTVAPGVAPGVLEVTIRSDGGTVSGTAPDWPAIP